MTRETAIEILKELWRTKHPLYLESDIRKALEMAIQALEQEPSGDLISRQDAIKAIEEKARRIKNEDTLNGLAGAVAILFDLPSYNSINSELSDDAISRQAVLDLLEDTNNGWIINEVSQLPPVKPQPCKDAISRQAVQDYIAKYLSQYLYNDVREAVEVIDEYIGELPSVKLQEPSGDLISRQEEKK